MRPAQSCPLCPGKGQFAYRAGDSFYKVTDYEADMYRCDRCGSLFQWPIPERETIAGFYPSGYWQEGESQSVMARLQGLYIHKIMDWDLMSAVVRMKLSAGANILDIGCSRGDWLARIRDYGYEVSGIEADPRAAAYAEKVHQISVTQTDVDEWRPQQERFDGILFFHLLEHLRKPAEFLSRCHTGLKPGGKILMRVPNVASLQAALTGKRWKGLEIPRHIMLFTPKALRELIEKAGFDIEYLGTWSLRDGPPALTSSLFPAGEPTWQQIHDKPSAFGTLVYLGLNWLLTPLEIMAALGGKGAMITVIARKN